jgi:hypothetical protein
VSRYGSGPCAAAARLLGGDVLVVIVVEVRLRILLQASGLRRVGRIRRLGVALGRDASGAGDDRGVELVHLARGMLELTGHVCPVWLRGRGPRVLRSATCLALLCSVSVTGHGKFAPLAGLSVAGVRPAPLAELPQRDAIWVVALALVGLIVTPLALLAGEGDSDAHVSAGHTPLRGEMWSADDPGQKKDPPRASRFRV